MFWKSQLIWQHPIGAAKEIRFNVVNRLDLGDFTQKKQESTTWNLLTTLPLFH